MFTYGSCTQTNATSPFYACKSFCLNFRISTITETFSVNNIEFNLSKRFHSSNFHIYSTVLFKNEVRFSYFQLWFFGFVASRNPSSKTIEITMVQSLHFNKVSLIIFTREFFAILFLLKITSNKWHKSNVLTCMSQ